MKSTTTSSDSAKYAEKIKDEFHDFIVGQDHPCIMANTVFQMEDYELNLYEQLGSKATAVRILEDLQKYISEYDFSDNNFKTFLAVFPDMEINSEIEFENLLWQQLQFIDDKDSQDWDPRVSNDPESNNFSFSIAGRAFYVIGMHPESSRMARRSPYPTLVFNLHWQFEKLREMGAYHNVRDKIRERDEELQGNINPVLADFGDSSEARQYSGRKVDESWKCPFHSKK